MQFMHSYFGHVRWHRRETNEFRAVRSSLANIIIGELPFTAKARLKGVKVTVELAYRADRKWDVFVVRMNDIKHVSVSNNFLLGSVARTRPFFKQLFDACRRHSDAF